MLLSGMRFKGTLTQRYEGLEGCSQINGYISTAGKSSKFAPEAVVLERRVINPYICGVSFSHRVKGKECVCMSVYV